MVTARKLRHVQRMADIKTGFTTVGRKLSTGASGAIQDMAVEAFASATSGETVTKHFEIGRLQMDIDTA